MRATWVPTAILVAFIVIRVYRRLRRTFGRQPVRLRAMLERIVVLSLAALTALVWVPTPAGIAAALAGLLVGLGLARLDLVHTRLEAIPSGTAYRANKWIGLLVTAIFVGRLTARALIVHETMTRTSPGASAFGLFQRSPVTLGLFFVIAAYHVAYYVALLQRSRAFELEPPEGPYLTAPHRDGDATQP